MGRIDLPYCQPVTSKGKTYYYYRRSGIRQRLTGAPGSTEFMDCYQRIHDSFENGRPTPGALPGSFEALIRAYLCSPEFNELADSTKAEYRYFIEPMRIKYGKLPIRGISRKFVMAYRDSFQDKPSKANHAVKVLSVVLSFAVDREMLDRNPAIKIKSLKTGPGWQAWPKAAIEKAHTKMTGPARIAFMLALYTGQRKGDVLAMRWDEIDDGGIKVKQSKTGTELWIPLHPTLQDELSKIKRSGFAIVARDNGLRFTSAAFSNIWRTQQDRHGFKGLQFHGLRKNATAAMFEAGCTPQETQAITGHKSLEMLQYYGKSASQKRLATTAMNKRKTMNGKLSGKPSTGGETNGR